MTEFGILGPLEVWRDGAELGLGGRNQRAVLALLLLQANQVVSIDRLAENLYGGAAPATAVTQVHRQVSELRRVLDTAGGEGASVIETRPPGYLIRVAPDELDLHRFEGLTGRAAAAIDDGDPGTAAEALREALALWRGPALADLAYESFAQGPAARLEELRLAALEARIEAELALAHHAGVIPELRDLAREYPLRERLRELLMVALYRAGRQVEALDLYRATRKELVETFGVEPGPGLQQVEQAILRHDPELSPPRDGMGWQSRQTGSVILVSRDEVRLEAQLAVAVPLARQPARELVVALLVGEEERLAEATAALSSIRLNLAPEARTAAFVASRGSDDILHLAGTADADLVLIGVASPLADPAGLPGELMEVLEKSSMDVGLLVAPRDPSAAGGGVLVPFGGGEHDWSAVELGAWLAAATGERLLLAGARPEPRRGRPDASRLLADASLAVQRLVGIAAEPALVDPSPSGLVEASIGASAVVIGLSPRWRREGLGEARSALARDPAAPLLVVHRGVRPSGIAPRESATRFTWSIAGG